MKIQLFLAPSFYYGDMAFKMLPTLGLPILASLLNKAGHRTEVVDLEALGVTPRKLRETFRMQIDRWPDVVGLGGLDLAARGIRDCIQELRGAGFPGRIVVGGAYASHAPEQVQEWGADLVVIGECEGNIVALLENEVTGIAPGEALPIEEIPSPDWNHFTPEITSYYGNMAMMRPNPGVTMWTRGCPYNCIFCANLLFKHKPTRYRPPENIEAEMKDLKQRGAKKIYVYDDELVGTKMPEGWMREVADRIEPLGFQSVTQGRCSTKYVTPELMNDVKRSSIHTVFWGVESFSQHVLDAVKKHITPEDIWHTLRTAKEAGVKNGLFMMIGNYQERDEDLEITANAMKAAYDEGLVDYCQTTVCTVMEGTELESIQKREGWYVKPDFAGRDLRKAIGTPWLSSQRIDYWQAKFYEVCPVLIPQ
jgi:anaerobic magnesium-protoporphyrin IX monomethyl ester cyclase